MPDRIFIENLRLSCSVGISPAERGRPQDVLVDLSVFVDLERAGKTDDVEYSINYRELKERISAFVSGREFGLLEALAEGLAELALQSPRAQRVTVRVRKGKYSEEPSIGVEVSRDAKSWSKP